MFTVLSVCTNTIKVVFIFYVSDIQKSQYNSLTKEVDYFISVKIYTVFNDGVVFSILRNTTLVTKHYSESLIIIIVHLTPP